MRTPKRADYLDRFHAHVLLREIGISGMSPVLEVGCGHGGLARYLAESGIEVFACDIKRNSGWVGNGAGMFQADAGRLPFPDAVFPLVLSVHTIDTFYRSGLLRQAVQEMARVAALGGTVLLVENEGGRSLRSETEDAYVQAGLQLDERFKLRGLKGSTHKLISWGFLPSDAHPYLFRLERKLAQVGKGGKGVYVYRLERSAVKTFTDKSKRSFPMY